MMWKHVSSCVLPNMLEEHVIFLVSIPSMYGIFTYIWLILMVTVDNIPYMDAMGYTCLNDPRLFQSPKVLVKVAPKIES